jgi:hypothetical protein
MYSRKVPFTRYNRLAIVAAPWSSPFVSRRSNPEQTIREFERWLEQNGYGHLLNSHTVSGARNDIQRWFNEEFKR